jgi:predicted DNA-binding transcriptional regulator AlpA
MSKVPIWVSVNKLAEMLDVSPRTVYEWKNRGGILPPHIKLSGMVRWKREDILRWINNDCKITST